MKRVGGVGKVQLVWLLPALLCIAGALWLTFYFPAPETETGWDEAAARVQSRIKPGEMVLIYPTWKAAAAEPLKGFPVTCDVWRKGPALHTLKPTGIWVVGAKKRTRRVRKALREFAERGTISFDDVHILHMWTPVHGRRGK